MSIENNSIGLVLAGGGAKGAFQAGVWKAMCELGLANRVKMISGTSVGTINAAAFAVIRNPDRICSFWRNRVVDVVTPNLRALSLDALCRAAENVMAGKAFPLHGLLDQVAIENMIRGLLPSKWPHDAPSVIATTLECRGGLFAELDRSAYRLRRFCLNEEQNHLRRVCKILASAAIPWAFSPIEIDGHRYVDGGWDEKGGENIPVTPILESNEPIDTLIVVRCNSREVEPSPLGIPDRKGLKVVEVQPRKTLRGIFGDLSDLVPDADFARGIPVLGQIVDNFAAMHRLLQSWSGTFAFNSDCVGSFIWQGYADGLDALRCLRPRETLNWDDLVNPV